MSYQVETGDIAISDALLKIAREYRWEIQSGLDGERRCRPYLVLKKGIGWIDWNNRSYEIHATITVPEFITLLKEGPPPKESVIMVGEYEVEFVRGNKGNGISIGCLFINGGTVDAIHSRFHKDDK